MRDRVCEKDRGHNTQQTISSLSLAPFLSLCERVYVSVNEAIVKGNTMQVPYLLSLCLRQDGPEPLPVGIGGGNTRQVQLQMLTQLHVHTRMCMALHIYVPHVPAQRCVRDDIVVSTGTYRHVHEDSLLLNKPKGIGCESSETRRAVQFTTVLLHRISETGKRRPVK